MRDRQGASSYLRANVALLPVAFLLVAAMPLRAEQATARIAGLGATTCSQFLLEIGRKPAEERTYLAWAQGFMSGVLLSRPPGVDEGLNLNPADFGLLKQLEFLREFCAATPSEDFSDGVLALYKRLQKEGAT